MLLAYRMLRLLEVNTLFVSYYLIIPSVNFIFDSIHLSPSDVSPSTVRQTKATIDGLPAAQLSETCAEIFKDLFIFYAPRFMALLGTWLLIGLLSAENCPFIVVPIKPRVAAHFRPSDICLR
jgi:hypothetical protein